MDFEEAREGYCEKYGSALKANADRVLDEECSSPLSFLRMKKGDRRLHPGEREGCHPALRVGMPGYWEGGETGRGKSPLAVRQHGHAVEEENRRLMIKDFGLGIDFAGGLRWGSKGVRLEVYRDEAENAWYASVQLKVSAETTQNGNESEHVVRGESRSV
ncbi:MAG: hypothetical protein RXR41_01630 [Candidatus Marsarchaeota archaeon]